MLKNVKNRRKDFECRLNEKIYLFGEEYSVQPHPSDSSLPFALRASRALICQVRNRKGEYFALKIFKSQYRTRRLLQSIEYLNKFKTLDGLRAASRRVVLPSDEIVKKHGNLEYAMLMPWITGRTWFDILLSSKGGFTLTEYDATRLSAKFLKVMTGLEAAGIAHTDISSGNVVVDIPSSGVELLDLEDIYAVGIPPPPPTQLVKGTNGYRHKSGDRGKSCWCAEGDRYAAAVLAAEILLLANKDLAKRADEDGYFVGHCGTAIGVERYQAARGWLEKIAPSFAKVFQRSWQADSLERCPKVAELHAAATDAVKPAAEKKGVAHTPIPAQVMWVTWSSDPTKRPPKDITVFWEPEQVKKIEVQVPRNRSYLPAVFATAATLLLILLGLAIYLNFFR